MAFADAKGKEIMDAQIRQIAEAMSDPATVATKVMVDYLPNPETGALEAVHSGPVWLEVTPDDG
jgi:hypothetical protein